MGLLHGTQTLQDHQTLGECSLPELVHVQVVLCEKGPAAEPIIQTEPRKTRFKWYHELPEHKRRSGKLMLFAVSNLVLAGVCFAVNRPPFSTMLGCAFLIACLAASKCAM